MPGGTLKLAAECEGGSIDDRAEDAAQELLSSLSARRQGADRGPQGGTPKALAVCLRLHKHLGLRQVLGSMAMCEDASQRLRELTSVWADPRRMVLQVFECAGRMLEPSALCQEAC